jgi:hypothetical protein
MASAYLRCAGSYAEATHRKQRAGQRPQFPQIFQSYFHEILLEESKKKSFCSLPALPAATYAFPRSVSFQQPKIPPTNSDPTFSHPRHIPHPTRLSNPIYNRRETQSRPPTPSLFLPPSLPSSLPPSSLPPTTSSCHGEGILPFRLHDLHVPPYDA